VLADVVNGKNVRVVQRGCGPRFLSEATQALGVSAERGRQHFDRHVAPETRIACFVDFPHPPSAERREDFIWTEPSAGV